MSKDKNLKINDGKTLNARIKTLILHLSAMIYNI